MNSFFLTTLLHNALLQEAQGTKTEVAGWYQILLWVGFFAIMYLFFLRPSLKQQKEQKNLLDNLKAGDKVITNGGIWGEIEVVEANRVRLKIADKVKIYVSRNAVHASQAKAAEPEKKS